MRATFIYVVHADAMNDDDWFLLSAFNNHNNKQQTNQPTGHEGSQGSYTSNTQ